MNSFDRLIRILAASVVVLLVVAVFGFLALK